jgi:nitrate/nitrite transport system ATP-binding protein
MMNAALEFRQVDILFGAKGKRRAAAAMQQALSALDAGATRAEVSERTGVIIGVANASLAVQRGQICVLMGLSGSGKSTLLRAANGITPVTRGEVLVNDGGAVIDIARCDAAALRRVRRLRIAMVFQQFALLPWRSVRDNVGFGLELRGEPADRRRRIIDEQLELVGLTAWSERFCHELSGGMQQRVGLARAFATDADILLMDEPFSALDALTRGTLQDEVRRICLETGQTAFMITHDVDEAIYLADRIFLMTNGPGAVLAEVVENPLPKARGRTDLHRHPYYYAVRNHIVDFLVSRSKTFATDMPDHDPRHVPLVRIGLAEPTLVSTPKAIESSSVQATAR